jgi:hypothetical protein
MDDLVQQFASLFEGRKDAYGTNDGGCQRVPLGYDHEVVWRDRIEDHLRGHKPLGVYPMVPAPGWHAGPEWVCRWGCSDIDIDDEQLAWNLHTALTALDITSWVERSRSKGYHVWVFAQEWVPARVMRRALLVAHEVAGVPAKEVNPKAETLNEGQLGNYVRLPYPGSEKACYAGRQIVLTDPHRVPEWKSWYYSVEEFVAAAETCRAPTLTLENAAKLWREPAPKVAVQLVRASASQEALERRLRGKSKIIYEEGPWEGSDRSTAMYRLCGWLKDDGFTPGEALQLLKFWRWNKFGDRPDGERRIEEMVASVYG